MFNPARRAWLGAAGLLAAGWLVSGCAVAQPRPSRIVLALALPRAPEHFTLEDPPRLVVDFPDASLEALRAALARSEASRHPAVRTVRLAQHSPAVVRLVLDLAGPARATVSHAADHLAIELTGPGIAHRAVKGPGASAHRIVVLDPGHGGADPGAVGPGGTQEKAVVLRLAQALRERLVAAGVEVVLTREEDVFVPLRQRVAIAREAKAALFLSLHADAWTDPRVRGSSVFALSERGATSELARLLAKGENEVDRLGGPLARIQDPHLAHTLLDLTQAATNDESLRLGSAVLSALGGANGLRKRYVERAAFAVLKAPDIPSVLVESAFISNPDEERKLADPAFQGRLAEALARGVRGYLARA